MTVALSRARLGLYILGRREVFNTCFELRHAFDRLLQQPTTLQVVPGEMHPTTRQAADDVNATEMTGLEHLGRYVYEMTQAKIQHANATNNDVSQPVQEAMEPVPVEEG